jgi:hypothetical protein
MNEHVEPTMMQEEGENGRLIHIMGEEKLLGTLTERQFREIIEKGPRMIHAWDLAKVKAFHKKRPTYLVEHIQNIAAECGSDGVPWHEECTDWHYQEDACSEG